MCTTGVVPNVATQSAVGMRRRVRSKGQMIPFGGIPEVVVDDTRLDCCCFTLWIDCKHAVEVLGKIKYDRDVAALTGETGTASAAQNGHLVLATQRDRFDYVLDIARDHHSDGNLSIN